MSVRRSLALAAAAAVLLALAWYVRMVHPASGPASSPVRTSDLPQAPPSPPARDLRRTEAPSLPSGPQPAKADDVDRLVASIDWTAFGGAVLDFTQEQERARREGRKGNYPPRTLETLARNNLVLQKLAEILGVEDLREIAFHERVLPSYARGWMKAVGVRLSPAQDANLGEAARDFSRSRAEERDALKDSNRLEKLAWEADRGLRWDEQVQKLLTPDQFADYAKPSGSDPFWGRQASRQELPVGGLEESSRRVEAVWQASLGLDEHSRTLVADVAREYVREVDRQIATFRALFPSHAPREEEMRLRVSLLRLQVQAERGLGQRLDLAPDRREGVEQGSGTVMDWRWN